MKNSVIILAILFICFGISAQQKTSKTTNAASIPVKLTTATDTLQYSLGAYLGQYIAENGFVINNPDLFIQGMNDAMGNKTLLVNKETVAKKINDYQGQMSVARNIAMEKQIFDSIKGKAGFGVLPSGVCYSIIKTGVGSRPLLTDSIQMHVKGFLPTGKLFEDTYSKNKPYKLTPSDLMPGLSETIQIMPVGSIWKIFIPSQMAFGEKGLQGLVPAYSAVIFEVELVK
jgi:FKBP-type peptidyl-prolyl cis-trans isomerase